MAGTHKRLGLWAARICFWRGAAGGRALLARSRNDSRWSRIMARNGRPAYSPDGWAMRLWCRQDPATTGIHERREQGPQPSRDPQEAVDRKHSTNDHRKMYWSISAPEINKYPNQISPSFDSYKCLYLNT